MNPVHKQQNLFHRFVLSADSLPQQANIFPYFAFMDLSIRKIFHQLKKTGLKKEKVLSSFEQFWSQLNHEQKVNLYCKWSSLLFKALQIQKNPKAKIQPQSVSIQDQIYIKTAKIFNKWDKRIAKLTSTHLLIISNRHTKQYQLKEFEIRRSKSKENFSWVLHSIGKKNRVLHCGVSNQNTFNQWYYALLCNINNQRIDYFLKHLKIERQNPGAFQLKFEVADSQEKKEYEESPVNKTLTQQMIDSQMKTIDRDDFSDFQESEAREGNYIKKNEVSMNQNKKDNRRKSSDYSNDGSLIEEKKKENPNVFKKLIPEYNSLMNFADTPVNCPLLQCTSEYRLYQLPSLQEHTSNLKMFSILPYPKSLLFQAITSEVMGWNDDVDVLTVKTNISSENTVLYYEKNKPQGLLYRERDYLYLRHCFSILNFKQKNTFIIDKSIDSIHQPPFMTVVRAEKRLIWGLIEKQQGKQCILILEGWIKGGGYMNQVQNRQMTSKFMKKILNIQGFAKQLAFSHNAKGGLLFKEEWIVDFDKIEEQNKKYNQNQNDTEIQSIRSLEDKQNIVVQQFKQKNDQKNNIQMQQFMKRTTEQHFKEINSPEQKSEVLLSDQRLQQEKNYKPPSFKENGQVQVPKQYLKKHHSIIPKEKPKKPKYFPHFRGHHLWKGEWEILNTGGLAYVDAEKMKEQKKVLTYIIKRIGKNIFSGKGILNISLPVDIFCVQSNIERLAMSFGFFPYYLQKAAAIKEQQLQIKYVISAGIASSLIYMTMEKPFNPILGETYQCWVDECPIYFQQISHHPPIAAFFMQGRGYKLSGCVQAKMDLSINSGTGNNEGVFTVQFDNGNTFHYTTPSGCLTGLTYGERKLNIVGKSYYWSNQGLYIEFNYNPAAKNKGFFGGGGNKSEGQEKLSDYFEGVLKKYEMKDVLNTAFKDINGKMTPIIPKSSPAADPIKTFYKISGRWNKHVICDGEKTFDVNETRYYKISDQAYPLPSHSNYREDIVYRRLQKFVDSQDWKQKLQIKQREDRKLKAQYKDNY